VRFPDCEAVTVTRPEPESVRRLPFNEAGPETDRATGRPEVAEAVMTKGAVLAGTEDSASKEIDWVFWTR